jgi:hypothetical protein
MDGAHAKKPRGIPGLHAGRLGRRSFSLALSKDRLTQIHMRSGRQCGCRQRDREIGEAIAARL